ncbi:YIP1 family protein [Paenibacillus lignilyticus]|uniref:YIP1 family protein n=1 Tax=Paenibacillus lignilyticus TaxID=1172615 RepID=A0ABS5CI73_9BACL|nr:YIP1 family protein [Paenibacillus lignilyticus]MBP3965530.1 YIP1 family protein [Paenibacillus lignilyticus]
MRTRLLSLSMLMAAFAICLSLFPGFAHAEATYKTYSQDAFRTPDAYEPVGAIEKAGDTDFLGPSDIYIDEKDVLYVADTGNKRIVELTRDGKLLRTIGADVLQSPTGVFVDAKGAIFVADNGLEQVLKFNGEGAVVQKFGRPDSPLYGKSTPFKPMKVTVDKRGNVYIISEGTTNGVIQMSPAGDFVGFFGTNQTQPTLKLRLQRFFFTEKQMEKLFKSVPNTPTNIAIDAKGLVYTVTQGDASESIKRLNISGYNLLPSGIFWDPTYTDMFVSASGNIFLVSQKGYFYEISSEGDLLFQSGSPDDGKSRRGLLLNGSGIALDSGDHIYITDKERNIIQVYEPTEFADLVHRALDLYKEGFYVKSQQPWHEVDQRNSLFFLAHRGLGDAYIKQQRYADAMDEYKKANDVGGYSDAFWEIRNRWLQQHLLNVILIIIGLMLLRSILRWIHRKTGVFGAVIRANRRMLNIRIIQELLFLFRFIKKPMDGIYGMKEESRTSNLSATLLYALLLIEYVFTLYNTGFIFNQADSTSINLTKELAMLIVPLAVWVISNYLVSTISEGEGKFSEVYQGTIYSLAPYLIFHPFVVIASNWLTLNDSFLFSFANTIITAWCAILLFIMVKEVHDYTIRETFRNLFITLFTMLIVSLVVFIVYVILHQVYDFGYSVIQEMITRAEL